jgi:hypothetical protein
MNSQGRYSVVFIRCSGALLLLSALAKLASTTSTAAILLKSDPVFGISFRHLFWLAGLIELAAALLCLFGRRLWLQLCVVAWLATSFVVYRAGSFLMGYKMPCSCLGTLTGALHIPPARADLAMQVVLAFLLCGSYFCIFRQWNRKIPEKVVAG